MEDNISPIKNSKSYSGDSFTCSMLVDGMPATSSGYDSEETSPSGQSLKKTIMKSYNSENEQDESFDRIHLFGKESKSNSKAAKKYQPSGYYGEDELSPSVINAADFQEDIGISSAEESSLRSSLTKKDKVELESASVNVGLKKKVVVDNVLPTESPAMSKRAPGDLKNSKGHKVSFSTETFVVSMENDDDDDDDDKKVSHSLSDSKKRVSFSKENITVMFEDQTSPISTVARELSLEKHVSFSQEKFLIVTDNDVKPSTEKNLHESKEPKVVISMDEPMVMLDERNVTFGSDHNVSFSMENLLISYNSEDPIVEPIVGKAEVVKPVILRVAVDEKTDKESQKLSSPPPERIDDKVFKKSGIKVITSPPPEAADDKTFKKGSQTRLVSPPPENYDEKVIAKHHSNPRLASPPPENYDEKVTNRSHSNPRLVSPPPQNYNEKVINKHHSNPRLVSPPPEIRDAKTTKKPRSNPKLATSENQDEKKHSNPKLVTTPETSKKSHRPKSNSFSSSEFEEKKSTKKQRPRSGETSPLKNEQKNTQKHQSPEKGQAQSILNYILMLKNINKPSPRVKKISKVVRPPTELHEQRSRSVESTGIVAEVQRYNPTLVRKPPDFADILVNAHRRQINHTISEIYGKIYHETKQSK